MKAHTIGQRIAGLRGTYSVDRDALAERSGVPVDLIAKIEDEGLTPELAALIKIARGFGVRLGTLLDDHEERGPVITRAGAGAAATRFATGLPGEDAPGYEGLGFRSLAASKGGRHMEPFLIDVKPATREKSAHEGEEFVYVLSGSVMFDYGDASEMLEAGDSAYYDSIVPHRMSCAGSGPARILAVVYAPL